MCIDEGKGSVAKRLFSFPPPQSPSDAVTRTPPHSKYFALDLFSPRAPYPLKNLSHYIKCL